LNVIYMTAFQVKHIFGIRLIFVHVWGRGEVHTGL
jgi:hypothetical protein